KHTDRSRIAGDACGLAAVQSHGGEGMVEQCPRRILHVALASVFLSHPVADMGRLRYAVTDISNGYAAEQPVALSAVGAVGGRRPRGLAFPVAAEAVPPCRALQFVARRERLPGVREGTAFVPQGRPFAVVRERRDPQGHARAVEDLRLAAE